ncbi:hypothetical protein, partial [uncultured Eubacterium sp.]|uniref:hypothetical protein n=1 Tax=uncultured Eubacterium sp. TaxID=165185 RepID=UPI0025F8A807
MKKVISLLMSFVMLISFSFGMSLSADAQDDSSSSIQNEDVIKLATEMANDYLHLSNEFISSLGMTPEEAKNATYKDVIARLSPMVIEYLGSSFKYNVDKKTFLMNHSDITGITAWSDKYYSYYSYLDDLNAKKGDINFYTLYTFCENNFDNDQIPVEVQDYCTETLPKLQYLLSIVSNAENEYNSNKNIGDMVYTGTNASGKGQPNNGLTKV